MEANKGGARVLLENKNKSICYPYSDYTITLAEPDAIRMGIANAFIFIL